MIIELIMIGFMIVFIIDYLNAPDEMYNTFLKLIFGKVSPYKQLGKPFNCSLCMTTWVSLGFIIFFYKISLYTLFLICINAFLTSTYYDAIISLKMLLERVFILINTKIK